MSEAAPCLHCHTWVDDHLGVWCVDVDQDEWDIPPQYAPDPNNDTSEDPDPLYD